MTIAVNQSVVYLAAPVSAPDWSGTYENLTRAGKWYSALRRAEPTVTFLIPWLGPLLLRLDDDSDPVQRERGLLDCCRVAGRCDGIVLVGGRISSGMQRELDAVITAGGWVADLTGCGVNPPPACFSPAGSLLEMGRNEWARRAA